MAPERARPWLDDMLDAIDWIERLTGGKTVADYRADRPLREQEFLALLNEAMG